MAHETLTAVELYEKETGKKSPSHQIAHSEWYIEYVKWLEEKVEKSLMYSGMIAFRTLDIDGDIWSENAFLFKTKEEVRRFFKEDNSTLLDIFTEENNRVLNNFEINDENPAGNITSIFFETEYAGKVRIYEMNRGFVCN